MIVAKFGGSALADGKNWQKVINIVEQKEYFAVVVSAPGARYKGDKKVTDLLYEYYWEKNSVIKREIWEKIAKRFVDIAEFFHKNIDEVLEETYKLTVNAELPFVVSRGEFITAELFARVSDRKHLDSAKVIKFNEKGEILQEVTEKLIKEACWLKNKRYVLGGFYGSERSGAIKLFERGGSDVSGAWVASALNAEIYENWTDVSGFFVCDPRIVANPAKINCMSFQQLKVLSTLGAGVLHHQSVYPTQRKNIPINIKNVFKPQDNGTFILPFTRNSGDIIGITAKDAVCYNGIQHKTFPLTETDSLLFYCVNCGFFTAVFKKGEEKDLIISDGILLKKEITLLSLLVDGKQKKSFELSQALEKAGFECQILCDEFGLINCATTPNKKKEIVSAVYKYFFGNDFLYNCTSQQTIME